MELSLRSRSAMVMGSTSGLGLATARGLCEEGVSVVFCGRRADQARAYASDYADALGLGVDLTDGDSVRGAVEAAIERYGSLDILVLNAGGPPPGTAADLASEELSGTLQVLLQRQIDIVSQVLPAMRDAGWGRIVAIGSSGVQQPIPYLVQSNVVRAGLAGYLKTLAGEVAADGVTVNMVLPGRIDTDRVAELDRNKARQTDEDPRAVRQRSEASIPAGRYGTPEEFAAAVVFLCGASASFINGVQLRVDGGMVSSF